MRPSFRHRFLSSKVIRPGGTTILMSATKIRGVWPRWRVTKLARASARRGTPNGGKLRNFFSLRGVINCGEGYWLHTGRAELFKCASQSATGGPHLAEFEDWPGSSWLAREPDSRSPGPAELCMNRASAGRSFRRSRQGRLTAWSRLRRLRHRTFRIRHARSATQG